MTNSGTRCADWAREVGLDPGGTAPRCDVFVLVEHPLPWPCDVGDDPLLAGVEQAVRARLGPGRPMRVQALFMEVPAPERRVVVFARDDGPVRGYGRLEAVGRPEDLADLAAALVMADPPPPERGGVTDVLICTHGKRDKCCGSLGTRLWRAAEHRGVRLWRTSHTGGHRFAPTAVTFPDGCYWGYLDQPTLAGIVDQTLAASVAAAHLRGCAAFPPVVQVADRAVLAERGWEWLASPRFGDLRGASRVQLCFEGQDQVHGAYDLSLRECRRLPIPDCGTVPVGDGKSQVEWEVTRVQRWGGDGPTSATSYIAPCSTVCKPRGIDDE